MPSHSEIQRACPKLRPEARIEYPLDWVRAANEVWVVRSWGRVFLEKVLIPHRPSTVAEASALCKELRVHGTGEGHVRWLWTARVIKIDGQFWSPIHQVQRR